MKRLSDCLPIHLGEDHKAEIAYLLKQGKKHGEIKAIEIELDRAQKEYDRIISLIAVEEKSGEDTEIEQPSEEFALKPEEAPKEKPKKPVQTDLLGATEGGLQGTLAAEKTPETALEKAQREEEARKTAEDEKKRQESLLPAEEQKEPNWKQTLGERISRDVFKDIVPRAIQTDGQRVLDAASKEDIKTLEEIKDKYAREAARNQGGGGAGPGKVKQARRGVESILNGAEFAIKKIQSEPKLQTKERISFYSQLQTLPPKVQAAIQNLKDLETEFLKTQEIKEQLKLAKERFGIDLDIRYQKEVGEREKKIAGQQGKEGHFIMGSYSPVTDIIRIYQHSDKTTIPHEIFHWFKDRVSLAAEKGNKKAQQTLKIINRLYKTEEHFADAGAQAWLEYNGGTRAKKIELSMRGIFKGLFDFLTKIKNAWQGMGFQTKEDVINKILEGHYKEMIKEAGVGKVGTSKLQTGESFDQWKSTLMRGFEEQTQTTSKEKPYEDMTPEEQRLENQKFMDEEGGLVFQTRSALQSEVTSKLNDWIQTDKTFNVLNRTLNTQYHKAEKDADYKKVYDRGQDFLSDFSRIAMDAEDKAPMLLSKVTRTRDLLNLGIGKFHAEKVGQAVFSGTLADKVYTDEELRAKGLIPKQIEYYREYRAAVDQSIDDLAKSTIAKIAEVEKVPAEWAKMNRDLSLDDFTKELYAEYFKEKRADLKADITEMEERLKMVREETAKDEEVAAEEAFLEGEIKNSTEELERLDTTISNVFKTKARANKLKSEGYAPLMRFGDHSVYVFSQDEEGKTIEHYFGLYESQHEASAAARELRKEFPEATVQKGVMSKEAHKLFKGLTPDVVEMFADITGLDKDPIFQDYLRLAVNNRSAMKRLMHRKGISGFSQDPTRTLSQFIVSNARLASSNYNMGEMRQAIQDIPKGKGDVKDEAVKLYEYLTEPKEEMAKFRGFLFFNYMGGSMASGIVNTTQPVLMTGPYLNQHASMSTVIREIIRASREAATHNYGQDVKSALQEAERAGLTSPHEIHQLMAEARVGMQKRIWWRNFTKAWGGFFSLAEQWNRQVTFIAAYRIAKSKGEENPFSFAKKAVEETQGVYNKGNRPNWARGAVGSTIMTFKQFSIAYIEFLKRLPRKQQLIALAVLVMASGTQGLPFREDLEDLIDTIGQWLGFATNTDKAVKNAVKGLLGQAAGEFVLHGVSAIPGVPLDIQGRMGLHNLIPGTAMLKPSEQNKGREVMEVFGPAGGVVQAGGKAIEAAVKGRGIEAVKTMLPKSVRDFGKMVDILTTGTVKDSSGRTITKDMDAMDAIVSVIGFNPEKLARQQRIIGTAMDDIAIQRTKESELAGKLAQAIFDKDFKTALEVRQEIRDWNKTNPEYRIQITSGQIRRRVRELRSTRSDRFLKRTPKEMRREIIQGMAE